MQCATQSGHPGPVLYISAHIVNFSQGLLLEGNYEVPFGKGALLSLRSGKGTGRGQAEVGGRGLG